jgi:hypothetical protein
MSLTPKQYGDLVKDVISAIEADLLDPVTGQFKHQPDYVDDAQLITDVEAAYKAHGGTVNANVDKAIAGVVAVLHII